jgi:hypothetical protein
MPRLRPYALLLALLLLAGCVTRNTERHSTAGPLVVLVRTDLGLGDGEFVREADAALGALDQQGKLRYQSVGDLPKALADQPQGEDVGLPVPQSTRPGEMTEAEAAALLAQAPPCDVLVLSAGSLLARALEAAAKGQLQAKCILLLDEEGMGPAPAAPPVPVYRLRYDIKHPAFLAGMAAAQSSSLAHFGIMYCTNDPQGAAFAGAKYQSNGSWTEAVSVDPGPLGYVTPDIFQQGFQKLKAQGGPNFKPDHYILDLGRSTPAIMQALTKKPTEAYVIGAYADYCQVRPDHIVGCALKRPGPALTAELGQLDPAAFAASPARTLAGLADKDGVIAVGWAQDAIDFTDLALYSRYNLDGADIKAVVQHAAALMRTGELPAKY